MTFSNMFSRTVWPQWLIASTISIVIGWALAVIMMILNYKALYLIAIAMPGIIVGIGQWFIFRQWVRWAGWWVLVTAIGWIVGWWYTIPAMSRISRGSMLLLYADWRVHFANGMAIIDTSLIGIVVFAIIIGVFQWFVLRQWVRRASWWIPARMIVAAIGWSIIVIVFRVIRLRNPHIFILWSLSIEAVMGIVLIWLFQLPVINPSINTEKTAGHQEDDTIFWLAITIALVCYLAAVADQLLLAMGSIPLLFFGKLKRKTQKVAAIGAVIIIILNTLSTVALFWLYSLRYGDFWWATLLIYAIFGFMGAYYGASIVDGILTAFYVAVADSTIGWSIPWILGPGRVLAGSDRILMSIAIGWITAIILGLIFGGLGRVFSKSGSSA
jgi:uncharacterized membrane protein YfcA